MPHAEVEHAQRVLDALNHPVRQRVLTTLYNLDEPVSFSTLRDQVEVSRPLLSHHLKPLVQNALVVNTYRKGEGREYSHYEISMAGRDWLERTGFVDEGSGEAYRVPA